MRILFFIVFLLIITQYNIIAKEEKKDQPAKIHTEKHVVVKTKTKQAKQNKKQVKQVKPVKKDKDKKKKKNKLSKAKEKNKPTNATIIKIIKRKLTSYQTLEYTMEKRHDGITTITHTYYKNPEHLRQESFTKGNEGKKRIRIISGNRVRWLSDRLFVEESSGPFDIFKINMDKKKLWRTVFETTALVKGRKAWQVKFLKEDHSYIRAWFDVSTGIILRREDFSPQGGKSILVGITNDLYVNKVLSPSLFEP